MYSVSTINRATCNYLHNDETSKHGAGSSRLVWFRYGGVSGFNRKLLHLPRS